jgi:hypothetical protein
LTDRRRRQAELQFPWLGPVSLRLTGGAMSDERSDSIFGGVETMLDDLEELYKKAHRRPE